MFSFWCSIVSFLLLLPVLALFIIGFASPFWLDSDSEANVEDLGLMLENWEPNTHAGLWRQCRKTYIDCVNLRDGRKTWLTEHIYVPIILMIVGIAFLSCAVFSSFLWMCTANTKYGIGPHAHLATSGFTFCSGVLGIAAVGVFGASYNDELDLIFDLGWAYWVSVAGAAALALHGFVNGIAACCGYCNVVNETKAQRRAAKIPTTVYPNQTNEVVYVVKKGDMEVPVQRVPVQQVPRETQPAYATLPVHVQQVPRDTQLAYATHPYNAHESYY